MIRGLAGALIVAAVSMTAPMVQADGGAAAATPQDKAKRKEKKPPASAPAKVFTDDDLKKYADERAAKPKGEDGETGQPSADTQVYAASPDASPAAEQDGAGKQVWNDKARGARDKVAEVEARIAALEARIAELRTDRGADGAMDPFRLQTIQVAIQAATAELDAARKDRDAAQAALDALIEDARRQGVPPGWVREP
jgi:hypothetical protein